MLATPGDRGGHAYADRPGDLAGADRRRAVLSERGVVEVPPSPAVVVTIARALEIAAHAQVERAVRRVREEGQDWAVIASLLGLDALPCHVADPARLAFGYCTGLARPPEFDRAPVPVGPPRCGQTIADQKPADSPACAQQGHAGGCERLAADVAE